MAENKSRGFGFSAEVQRKMNAKYNKDAEMDARRWIEDVIEERVHWGEDDDGEPGKGFAEGLKSGEVLCKLANKLQPGAIKKINDIAAVKNSAMKINKERENIEKFLKFCDDYDVKDHCDLPSLYEKKNVMAAVDTICQCGSKAQVKGFKGPTLGPKMAEANVREFTEEQLKAGQNEIGLQMGSNKGASQAGEHFGRARQIAGHTAYN